MKKLTLLFLAGLGSTAHANAFLLNEFDARAVGRGNAVSASDVEPSAIYYNIGGLGGVEGTQAIVSGSLITPDASFTESATGVRTESNTNTRPLAGAFAATRITDWLVAGVGVASPFGLAVTWPAGSPVTDVVEGVWLRTYFITPSVGFNLGQYVPGLTVGAGVDIVPSTVEITQSIFFGDVMGTAHLAASAIGFGGRAGAMYRPDFLPEVSVGAMWRSEVKEDYKGNGDFDAPTPFRSALPPDGRVTTSIALPQQVTFGAAVRPFKNLEIEGNGIWTEWSKFSTLDINVPSSTGAGTMVLSQQQGYTNTWSWRAGAEYGVPEYGLGFRAGYIYDPTPIPAQFLTPQLPDINRNDVTAGISKTAGDYTAHLAGLVVLPDSRSTAMDPTMPPAHKGTFDVSAWVISVSVSGKFPELYR